ncbi:hypothetical protein K437DRAFT_254418 [Tilletiaria anomala UBC 951]|uniref:RNI-like protein n=1 Tax=Tilletiaria anomala (strain ATCC 24038 / CBS 436.72 / UBC 951) TaxID=1037660 RepID=A0A066WEN8_TILAU|nr:uncharacterized protein K437DRAFT_254418 [Tilletiaria anomala UBC 951]KDN52231.1 hypothetical protein K437DRAFT_254418 [Tilletiaria anomala UBC 951]
MTKGKQPPPAVVVTKVIRKAPGTTNPSSTSLPSSSSLQSRFKRTQSGTSGNYGMHRSASSSNKRRKVTHNSLPQEKLSIRAEDILGSADKEDAIKSLYGPQPRTSAISSRVLPYTIDERHFAPTTQFSPRAEPLSLADMCIRAAAHRFDSHVLPLGVERPIAGEEEQKEKERNGPNGAGNILEKARVAVRKPPPKYRARTGLFNYDEGADQDYAGETVSESSSGTGGKSRRHGRQDGDGLRITQHERLQREWHLLVTKEFWHLRNAYLLRSHLPPSFFPRLQEALLQHNPRCLTRHVLATYFVLGREDVKLTSSIDALSNNPWWPATLLSLILAPGSATINSSASLDASFDGNASCSGHSTAAAQQALRSLRLEGLTRISTGTLGGFFRAYRSGQHLRTVSLRGCVGIGASAMAALVSSSSGCGRVLKSINLDHTDIGPEGLEELIKGAGAQLEVLKVSSVERLNDETVIALLQRCKEHASKADPPFVPLAKLRTLKARKTAIGDVAISSLLWLCAESIENINIANTQIAHRGNFALLALALGLPGYEGQASVAPSDISSMRSPTRVRKLVLSGLLCYPSSFHKFIHALCLHPASDSAGTASSPDWSVSDCRLETLVLDDMRMSLSHPDSARRLEEHGLSAEALESVRTALLPVLRARASIMTQSSAGAAAFRPLMDRISLAANARLGSRSGAIVRGNAFEEEVMHRFVRDVGRVCRRLDLGGITIGVEDVPFAVDSQEEQEGEGVDGVHALSSGSKRDVRQARCTLQELIIHADVQDEVLDAIEQGCTALRRLDLAGSHASPERVDAILVKNRFLTELDLTLCRGIARGERRDYFAVRAAC